MAKKTKGKKRATTKRLVVQLIEELERYMTETLDKSGEFDLNLNPALYVTMLYDEWGSGYELCERFKIGEERCSEFLQHVVGLLDAKPSIIITYDEGRVPLIKKLAELYRQGRSEDEIDEWITTAT